MELELEAWREVARHLDMPESLSRVLPAVRRHLPIAAIAVRRIDLLRSRVETAAIEGALDSFPQHPSELTPRARARVARFFEEGRTCVAQRDPSDPLFAGDSSSRGDVILLPLADGAEPIGVLALFAREDDLLGAEQAEVAATLIEPFSVALQNDRRLHELAQLREAALAENRALLTRLNRQSIVDSIVGEHGGLRLVMERVSQVARTDVPVLLLGETGSGKEVIARAIHERSTRHSGPIVRVNCGAIPTELVDSELFGHERGSFTGAVATRKGWFERADGGTLLLDEVGELPAAAQVRLLRILQEGTLERVGGQRTLHVDVRIVAATHRDLQRMVSEGSFREDLWYRLSVFPLRLPSLRERKEDIAELACHFASRAGQRLGAGALIPSAGDLDLLRAYPWPGNVRELAAVIERAAILGHGRKLEVRAALGAALPVNDMTRPIDSRLGSGAPSTKPELAIQSVADDSRNLDQAMIAHIERVLENTRGRIEGPHGAAAAMGINPHTLRARMRKLGIVWSRFRAST